MRYTRVLTSLALWFVLVGTAAAGCRTMTDQNRMKLGPQLLERLELRTELSGAEEEVVVLIGLNTTATPELLDDLQSRGLSVRSTVGDVLTGTVPLDRLQELSEHENILKIDASSPVFPEDGEGEQSIDVE